MNKSIFESVGFINESVKFFGKADGKIKQKAKDIEKEYKPHFNKLTQIAKEIIKDSEIIGLNVDTGLQVVYTRAKEYSISIVGSDENCPDKCLDILRKISSKINEYIKDNNLNGKAEAFGFSYDSAKGVVIYIK